ncbi:putative ATP synthase F0, A subunit [Fructobacillus pseudoficulneus]|uniref:Putative ATP synthase F0, A subunit n=1 Tax=Fructobacillus pseudoficulneus TaxID=220714 RepID=A0A3F3GRL8_9LACO|nr:hypothetical protein [Fructobacillus pseudoficulneus]GAP02331.1 putative ATP synthase F0, A subunit [Fructobacillus pseudoficulneus]SEH36396.1 hypothetical protein SAMN05660469_0283 [Fructobacillus pseudoficulneus]
MGMLANSHVLSLIMAFVFIIVYILVQIFNKSIRFKNFVELGKAVFLSLIIGSYSLFNIFSVYTKAKILAPDKILVPLDPGLFFDSLLQNNLNEKPAWTYGLPLFILQIVLTVIAVKTTRNYKWKSWVLGANILTLLMFNWLPWDNLLNTSASLIQFLGRLELIIVLMLAVGACLYANQSLLRKSTVLTISLFMCLFSLFGFYQTHQNYINTDNHEKLTSGNYEYVITNKSNTHDY